MVDVKPLWPDDWETTRKIRLRALLDAPEAFGGTYEETAKRDEASWRSWPSNGQAFAAYRDGEPVGMACGWLNPDDPDVTNLIGMWVAPDARGTETSARLIDAVVGWAGQRGSAAVELVVYETNARARRAYEKYGFTVDRPSHEWRGQVMRLALP
jgi:GNAT superfamily N-acetyltransferase